MQKDVVATIYFRKNNTLEVTFSGLAGLNARKIQDAYRFLLREYTRLIAVERHKARTVETPAAQTTDAEKEAQEKATAAAKASLVAKLKAAKKEG